MFNRLFAVTALTVALTLAGLSALSQPSPPSAPAPSAASVPPDQTVTVTAPTVPITLPAPVYVIASREFEPLRGQYALADGRTLTVSGRPKRMKAQIEGLPPAELVAASPSVLVARNRQMSLTFRQADNGVVRDVLVTYVKPVEVNGRRISR
jgi:hypothetical protein